MGCVGFAAPAAREDTAGVVGVVAVGEAAEVAEGVMGVVGTWEEPRRLAAEVEVGVTAVDGLGGNNYLLINFLIKCEWRKRAPYCPAMTSFFTRGEKYYGKQSHLNLF